MRKALLVLLPAALLAFAPIAVFSTATPSWAQTASLVTKETQELRMTMRKLWEDHITYTRNFIISALGDLPDKEAVVDRLMKNQEDIGNAVKTFYGNEAGDKLTELLRSHISIAAEVVQAAKDGNQDQLRSAQERWNTNGKDIATFLAAANPNWSQADLESALQRHLDLTTNEVAARLEADWTADIAAYDEGHEHMLMFADTLSDGIIKQFKDKFPGA